MVVCGKKTATTSLYKEGSKLPRKGDRAAIRRFDGKQFCIIEYVNVDVMPFLSVGYDYVAKEGESDKDVEEWRQKHRAFFRLKDDNVKVICEEFKVIS